MVLFIIFTGMVAKGEEIRECSCRNTGNIKGTWNNLLAAK